MCWQGKHPNLKVQKFYHGGSVIIYPTLSRMARDYLAIPATSASSERLFSSGKLLITDNRNILGVNTIEAVECLKCWL